jgi:multidrug efflux system outer membrane protein
MWKFRKSIAVMKYLFFLLLLFATTGCLVGPKYARPDSNAISSYITADSLVKDTTTLIAWTEIYRDPELTKLIRTVLDSNLDLLTSVSRIEESRALYGFAKASLYPNIGYSLAGGVNNLGNNAQLVGVGVDNEFYKGFGTMSWELDLFGKLRHQNRSSWAKFLAEQNNAQAVRVSLIAETATYYFLLLDLDNRLQITNKTVTSRTNSLKLISDRFSKGYVSELDELQAKQQLAQVEALVPNLKRAIIEIENALRLLSGQAPGPITRGYDNYSQKLPLEIPEGIPSQLLQRRPDIIAAEQLLIAQTEQIGVATALRFPTLSLTGFLGVASPSLNTILDPASFAAGVGGSLFGPLFEFNKNKRRVDVQRQQAEQFSYQYQKKVLKAFSEVDYTLAAFQTYKVESDARKRELDAALKAFKLTEARYNEGYSNYLELLNQQDNLLSAQINESIVQSQANISVVNLFKALGGGWNAK